MILTPEADALRVALGAQLRLRESIELHELEDLAKNVAAVLAPRLSMGEVHAVVARLMEMKAVTLDVGVAVIDPKTFTPWLADRKKDAELRRSNAYDELLDQKGWSGSVVEKLGEQTDRVVELVGDPEAKAPWKRRGLAIGEVQSGKTATYIGVLAKAIDYGYKVIIVIGGHTEDLRRQTQSRIDSDLTGVDSAYLADNIVTNDLAQIGIGQIDKHLPSAINVLTTTQSDFSATSKRAGQVALGAGTPTIFVIKKNVKMLKNLTQYLHKAMPKLPDQPPLLLIDDEADWASINTNSEDDVTAVNAGIRELLGTSNRNSYLGITATPFANIFINDEIEEDLFPRDYIQVLESPSNYQGVGAYFSRATHSALIEDVEDTLAVLPYAHKASHKVKDLPGSMKKAIAAFYVGTAIRRLRDGRDRPASMLINASRFKAVQARLADLAGDYVRALNATILGEFGLPEGAGRSERAGLLADVFAELYSDADVTWMSVRQELVGVADELRVQLINGDTKPERDRWLRETQRRIKEADALIPTIYVGGDVLARGLTLDGLQISYYSRRASAADTLLQMGRWFGYRPGYEDLVRIWIDPETSELFRWTADQSEELRHSLRQMNAMNLTPLDFGLRMRRHPQGFQIASARKMRNAGDFDEQTISLNSTVWESHTLPSDDEDRDTNLQALLTLVARLPARGDGRKQQAHTVWRDVDSDLILEFFHAFKGHPASHPFGHDAKGLSPLVTSFHDIKNWERWDVALIGGAGPELPLSGVPTGHHSSVRNRVGVDRAGRLRFPNSRVAAGADLLAVVREDAADMARAHSDGAVNDRAIARKALVVPMLLLYLVTRDEAKADVIVPGLTPVTATADRPIAAAVVATPLLTPEEEQEELLQNRGARWKINRVYAREVLGWPTDPSDDETEEDQ